MRPKPANRIQRRNALTMATFLLINQELLGNDAELGQLLEVGTALYRAPVYPGELQRMREALQQTFDELVGELRIPALGLAFLDSFAQEMLEVSGNRRRRAFWQQLYDYTCRRLAEENPPIDIYERAERFFQHAARVIQGV